MRGACGAALVLAAVTLGAQAAGDLTDVLMRVSDRVRQYYGRAQRIVSTERVMVQPLRRDLGPDGFGRLLEFELRVDWDESTDADSPPEAHIIRELRKVNGRPPRAKDEAGCLDPKSGVLDSLAILLPHHLGEYTFAVKGSGNIKGLNDRRAMMLDYRSRAPGKIEGTWKGDCVSIEAPGRTKGRIWVDEATHDVLRLDEELTGQFEYNVPREHWGFNGPMTWIVERADSSIRYRPVVFHDPEETVLLPDTIESLTVFRNMQSYRISQSFTGYKRFVTGGRIVK